MGRDRKGYKNWQKTVFLISCFSLILLFVPVIQTAGAVQTVADEDVSDEAIADETGSWCVGYPEVIPVRMESVEETENGFSFVLELTENVSNYWYDFRVYNRHMEQQPVQQETVSDHEMRFYVTFTRKPSAGTYFSHLYIRKSDGRTVYHSPNMLVEIPQHTATDISYPAVWGDVDANGNRNAMDALKILRFVVGLDVPTEIEKTAADVDGNGIIDSNDATDVLLVVVRLKEHH